MSEPLQALRPQSLRIGVDFDNTIICYDQAFAAQAREKNLLPAGVAPTKLAIRDFLRAAGREDEWTRLQGEVYGPGILAAEPFAGVAEFFAACAEAGVFVRVISHKTARPYLGEPHDLHAWARSWLTERGFFDGQGLSLEQVEFWPTKGEKAGRIRELNLTHFIDDLPEFLAELDWPGLTRVLFDPNCAHAGEGRFACAASWPELTGRLLGVAGAVG
jgi:hypothetical protein